MREKFVRVEPEDGTPTVGVTIHLMAWEMLRKRLALAAIEEPHVVGWVVWDESESERPNGGTEPNGKPAFSLSCSKCEEGAVASVGDVAVFMREGWPICCGMTMNTRRLEP